VTSISEWIAQTGKRIVLDVACGTGFPSIDLLKLGFQITCCDGSPLMLQEFRRNAAIVGVAVEPHCILWKDLPQLFASSSDIIMCRGNSLAYAGTWDEAHMASRRTITEALHNFYCCLKPGGIVYVDTASEKYLNAPTPESRTYTEQSTNGHIICLSETVYTDPVLLTRTWISKLTFGPSAVEFKRHCYLLQHSELCEMLREAGFRNITRCNIAAEHYAVFLGYKE
jgi:ubiquinone/menaquinone biosynthesis C-methylase UbiE